MIVLTLIEVKQIKVNRSQVKLLKNFQSVKPLATCKKLEILEQKNPGSLFVLFSYFFIWVCNLVMRNPLTIFAKRFILDV